MLTRAVGVFVFASLAALFLFGLLGGEKKQDVTDAKVSGEIRALPLLPAMPALVLEFKKKETGLQQVVTNIADPQVRRKLQADLRGDCLFIATYLLLYAGIALVLGRSGGRWVWVAALAVACVAGAAAADGMENLAMARAVEHYEAASFDIATPGFVKWALSFAALALLSFTFRGRGWRLSTVLFWLSLSAAVLGWLGLLAAWRDGNELRLVQLAFVLAGCFALLVGFAFARHPEKF